MAEQKEGVNLNFWAPVVIVVASVLLLLGWVFTFPW